MNDFTKDQLETLRNAFYSLMVSRGLWRTQENNLLVDKIQSMIENYCEHDPYGDFHVCVNKCKKCGVIVDDNQ